MDDKIDALDLLNEYIRIYSLITLRGEKYDSLPWDNQIRVKRILALLNAYLSNETIRYRRTVTDVRTLLEQSDNDEKLDFINDFFGFRSLSLPEINDTDFDALVAKIKGLQRYPKTFDRAIEWQKNLGSPIDRRLMLDLMMRARLKSAEMSELYSGILEGNTAAYLAVNTVATLYYEHLKESDTIIDDIIVGLMGSVFKRNFTKEELVSKFGYPKETDRDLFDYYIDNL